MQAGDVLTLDIEKPAAGGRMLARHQGRVVLVSGAIPGERVTARIERVSSAVVFAETVDVTTPSARRPCHQRGSAVRRLRARARRLRLAAPPQTGNRSGRLQPDRSLTAAGQAAHRVITERGYRMRARLHVSGGRLGFFREGTHDICDPVATGQLAESTDAMAGACE
jgi:23S rRNA (uracil1939-C5)-methyltransferase